MNQLAVDAGLRRATMYAWFSGKVSPEMESLSALATACKVHRWQILAAMDGYDFSAARRAVVAEEVEAAVAPLRSLLRDAGLLRAATTPDATAPAGPNEADRAA